MSNQLSLSYEAQRSIIPHLDVHLRIELSNCCRSLRTLDSLLPLKIQSFQMSRHEFKVNNIVYKIGIIKVWKKEGGPTPDFVKQQNRVGGYPFDVNEYGLVPNIETDVEFILGLRNRIVLDEKTRYTHNHPVILRRELDENTRSSMILKLQNEVPPYTMYLQILRISDDGVRRNILQHDHTIQQTKDYIWTKIFGTRKLVKIQNFEVEKISVPSLVWKDFFGSAFYPFEPKFHGARDPHNYRIPCLPFDNQRLAIQKLKLDNKSYNFLDAIHPILMGSLKMVTSSNLEHPIVRASEFLITGTSPTEIFSEIPNSRVHIRNYMFIERRISTLVAQWKSGRSLIGVHYSFAGHDFSNVESFLLFFGMMDGARKVLMEALRGTAFPECIIVPLKVDSEAIVYCEKSKPEDREFCSSNYIMRIKIQGNGRGLDME